MNVIKVIWGSDWDPLLACRRKWLTGETHGGAVDGDYQKYSVRPELHAQALFRKIPGAAEMVNHLTD